MSHAVYGPRINVHPTRQGALKSQGPDVHLVIHTSQGPEGDNSAEALGSFMTTPATATNVASYHAVSDTDRILPAVEYRRVAYAAGGGNARGRHICIPGDAGQTREQWLDTVSRKYIRRVAEWLCDQHEETGIPLRRLTVDQVRAYAPGVCDHDAISKAFGKSNHWDVGPNFPWDVLFAVVDEILNPAPIGGSVTYTEVELLNPDPTNRILDSRWWGAEAGRFGDARPDDKLNGVRTIPCPRAKGAKAVKINVTATEVRGSGILAVWGSGARPQNSSKLNYTSIFQPRGNQQVSFSIDVANEIETPVAADGSFKIYASADIHCVIDLVAICR